MVRRVFGGLLVLVLTAVGLYIVLAGPRSKPDTVWVPFEAPDGSFAAAFPNGPPTVETPESMLRQSRGTISPEEVEQIRDVIKAFGIKLEGWTRDHDGRKFYVMAALYPPSLAKLASTDDVLKGSQDKAGAKVLAERSVTSGGLEWKEAVTRHDRTRTWVITRAALTAGGKVYMLMVESHRELTASDQAASAFFEKFQWKK